MNDIKFQEIKKNALEEKIPIIMDDTLAYLDKLLINSNQENILEIRNGSPATQQYASQNTYQKQAT